MHILHVSDFHLEKGWLVWLATMAPSFDLIALTGDVLDLGHRSPDALTQIVRAQKLLREVRGPLALCSGNHDQDWAGKDYDARWMESLRREGLWIDGDIFQLSGYQFRCVGWGDPIPWEMRDEIVLMHAPPFGAKTSMVVGGISFGDEAVRETCLLNAPNAPRMLLGGHVHSALRFHDVVGRTTTLNPGRGSHPEIPNHIIIDLKECTAEHREATSSGITSRTIEFNP